jgi:HEAT repeat protein
MAEEDVDLDFSGVLRQCLQDDDPGVRDKAVSGLWECDDRTLLTPFIQLLSSDPEDRVRASAAISLGKFSTLAVLGKLLPKDRYMLEEILISVAKSDKESLEVRRRALESVAVFNTDDINALIRQGYQSLEINMRISAVYAMGRTCETEWLPAILHELDDHNPSKRY